MLLELLHSARPSGAPQGKGVGAGSLELWIGSGGVTLLPAVGGPGCTEQRPHASQMLAARRVQAYRVPAATFQSPASLLVLIREDQGEGEWGVYEPPAACLVLSMAGMRLMKQITCPGCLLHLKFFYTSNSLPSSWFLLAFPSSPACGPQPGLPLPFPGENFPHTFDPMRRGSGVNR